MPDVSEDDFSRVFDDTLNAIRPFMAERDDEEPAEPILGIGEALEGLIRVTAAQGGQLESVEVDPKALRSGSEELAEAFKDATNAALRDLQEKLAANLPEIVDQQVLMERLQEFQNQAAVQMGKYLRAITEVQERLDRD